MTAEQRRSTVLSLLEETEHPVSASLLAQQCGVSRQVIVGDIALLRAAGSNIAATPRGSLLERPVSGVIRQLVCRHSAADAATELNIIVDCGCTAVDVSVEHPVYGQITAALQISSRYDVEQFVTRMGSAEARHLSSLTEGIHLHTVLCPDNDRFSRLQSMLKEKGFLLTDND